MEALPVFFGEVCSRLKNLSSHVGNADEDDCTVNNNNNNNNGEKLNDKNNNSSDRNLWGSMTGSLSNSGADRNGEAAEDVSGCNDGVAGFISRTLEKVKKEAEESKVLKFSASLSNLLVYQITDFLFLDPNKSQVDNVILIDRYNSRKQVKGTFYITSTHIIFVDPDGKKEVWISHMHVSSMEKHASTSSGYPLQIRGKNFINVTFIIPKEKDCQDVYLTLSALSKPASLDDLYAFHFSGKDPSQKQDGWDFFDIQSEYMRMGVPNENWSLSMINKDYEICDTYPKYLYVPATSSTPMLISSAKFRSRGRLPVLSYLHRFNQATICRCSQPLVGFSARCLEDESLFQSIRKANPASKSICVVDTRPRINALANRATGKGYENESFYSNVKFHFCSIENIHVMRSSLQKLVEVCELQNSSTSAFLSGLDSSGWLKHIKSIIDTSVFVARKIHDNESVIVHCSDGWDRTAQVTSLSSLMLDPYYRTISGFQILIEKEWLAFGHKFTERCGFTSSTEAKEISPVFTQFIDCVWQLMQQFPRNFQFNEKFLATIHDHVYSCQFGTFIGCCEKDRIDLRLNERTYSLWGYTSKYTRDFSNPFFKKDTEISMPVIIPVTNPQSIRLWRAMYCRYDNGIHPRESIVEIVRSLKDHTESLNNHRSLLEKRTQTLWALLGYKFTEESLEKTLFQISSSDSVDFRTLLDGDSSRLESHRTSDGDRTSETIDDGDGGKNEGRVAQKRSTGRKPLAERLSGDAAARKAKAARSLTVSSEQMLLEVRSVAHEWKSPRGAVNCSCAMPFEQHSMKNHCWSCGNVFCTRCIDRYTRLPGHLDGQDVPVCKTCFRLICNSPPVSVDDFQKLQEHV